MHRQVMNQTVRFKGVLLGFCLHIPMVSERLATCVVSALSCRQRGICRCHYATLRESTDFTLIMVTKVIGSQGLITMLEFNVLLKVGPAVLVMHHVCMQNQTIVSLVADTAKSLKIVALTIPYRTVALKFTIGVAHGNMTT